MINFMQQSQNTRTTPMYAARTSCYSQPRLLYVIQKRLQNNNVLINNSDPDGLGYLIEIGIELLHLIVG